ncbi:MAG: hypothetical protein ACRDSP_26555, partial [Pseudonocardiaceae bacterium]
MSEDDDLWPVEPSQVVADALADPRLPVDQFARIVALTVAIAQDPWLPGSRPAEQGEPWRTANWAYSWISPALGLLRDLRTSHVPSAATGRDDRPDLGGMARTSARAPQCSRERMREAAPPSRPSPFRARLHYKRACFAERRSGYPECPMIREEKSVSANQEAERQIR